MSPTIDRETDVNKLYYTKFLRVGRKIVYDSIDKDHSQIAWQHHLDTVVDDGGYIEPVLTKPDFKIIGINFTSTTKTCHIKGDRIRQRSITNKVATRILGKEVVKNE